MQIELTLDLSPTPFEERVKERPAALGRAVEVADPLVEAVGAISPRAIAGSRTPSIIAVNVLRVKPSTSRGRLSST